MTAQSFLAFIDQLIQMFWQFARSVLGPISVLCAFFAGVKMVIVVLPFLAAWIPSMFIKGEVLSLAATSIACALASGAASLGK